MGRRLAYSVIVREVEPVHPDRPELGVNLLREETFLAGQTLPGWAQKCVGDHVYELDEDDPDVDDQQADDPGQQGDGAGDQTEAPSGNASTEEWAAYALSKGATAEQIDGLGRDQLREQFGA